MSKFILKKRVTGFTVVSNNVVAVLKNNLKALGFYLYLLSLPDEWEFYKTQLSKECSIGTRKVDELLHILKSHGLVKYGQERNEKGQFERFYLEIYDVEQVEKPKEDEISPDGNFCRTAKPAGRFQQAIQEEAIQEEVFKENKQKSSLSRKAANERRHDFAESMDQMACEARNIEQNEEFKRAPVPDNIKCLLGLSGFKS